MYQNISLKEKIGYGMGDFATGFGGVTIGSFVLYYYTDIIGVSASIIGGILLFSRFFDAITNVIIGILLDKTQGRYGKAKTWILYSTIPFAIFLVLSFVIPVHWDENIKLIYITIILNIYFLMYTASNIPYGTLASLITQDSNQRSFLNIFRMIGYFIVSILIPIITLPLVKFFGDGQKGWLITITIYALIMTCSFFIMLFSTKERVFVSKNEKNTLKESLSVVILNKYWLIMFGITLLSFSILGLLTGVNVYYAKVNLDNINMVGTLNILFFFPLIIGLALTSICIKIIGRRKTVVFGMILLILGSAFMLFDSTNILIISLGSIVRGIGFAPIMGNAYAMLLNTIDYGEWKTGIRSDGLVYSAGSFSAILGSGVASGGIGWVLGLSGYHGDSINQPIEVSHTLEFLFIYTPLLLSILIIILLIFYNLDNFYNEIIKDLNSR